jgi:hypothetical protein
MTYHEFVMAIYNSDSFTDDKIFEHLHYTQSVFEALTKENQYLLAKKIAKTSSLMEVFGKAHSETNPGWIRIVLSLMAQVLVDQGVATSLPRPQDQIARSESKWLISASFVSIGNHKDATFNLEHFKKINSN